MPRAALYDPPRLYREQGTSENLKMFVIAPEISRRRKAEGQWVTAGGGDDNRTRNITYHVP